MRKAPQDEAWIMDRVFPEPTSGCWLWIGAAFVNGYGYVVNRKTRKKTLAHRFSYQMFNGKIPDGKFVCHKCDVPSCVNPHHLFVGTHTDNMSDMAKKDRAQRNNAKKTHCPAGHAYSGDNLHVWRNRRICKECRKENYKRWYRQITRCE